MVGGITITVVIEMEKFIKNASNRLPKILLLGAGQIGSRHLQGLARITFPIEIFVFDPSESALQLSSQRFNEIKGFEGSIHFMHHFPKDQSFDITIVATNADVRREVIELLLKDNTTTYLILEKFLFQQSKDFADIQELLTSKEVPTWVNCPRRLFPFYQEIKKHLENETEIHFSVSRSNMNLGSNAIHFLDLFAFLSSQQEKFTISSRLHNQIFPSKRKGNIEFSGSLYGSSGKISFDLHGYQEENIPDIIYIQSPNYKFLIRETDPQPHVLTMYTANNWQWERQDIRIPYQSELTNIICDQLLSIGNCDVTPYAESLDLHMCLFPELLNHYNKVSQLAESNLLCPIS